MNGSVQLVDLPLEVIARLLEQQADIRPLSGFVTVDIEREIKSSGAGVVGDRNSNPSVAALESIDGVPASDRIYVPTLSF